MAFFRRLVSIRAVLQGSLDELERGRHVPQALVHLGQGQHELGIGRGGGVALLEPGQLAAQLLLREVQALRALQLARTLLVLDELAAVRHLAHLGARERRLGGQVLARLEGLLVARVGLQGALVVAQGALGIAALLHHRSGALERLGVAGRDLGRELVHRARGTEVAGLLQGLAEHQVGLLVQRVGSQVVLERARAGLVLA
jgi:hypothetical protein